MGRNDRGNSPAVGARHNRDAAPMRIGFTHIPDAEQEVLSAPHTLITGMHVPNGGTAPWRSANRSLRSPRRCSGTFPGISADGRATDVGGATEGSPPPIPRQSAVAVTERAVPAILGVPRRRHCRRCFARHRSGVPVGSLGRYAAPRPRFGAAPSPACGKRHPSGEKFAEFFALQRTLKTGPRTFRCTAPLDCLNTVIDHLSRNAAMRHLSIPYVIYRVTDNTAPVTVTSKSVTDTSATAVTHT